MTNKALCIYHKGCTDGYTAAWIVRNELGENNVDFHASLYGDPIPDVDNRDVYIVDFSYPPDVMLDIATTAKSLTVIDHHKTAAHIIELSSKTPVTVIYDTNKSGANLTWEFFNPYMGTPDLVAYVEDRDLWKFVLPDSKEVNAWIRSFDYQFDNYDNMHCAFEDGKIEDIISQGSAILRAEQKMVLEICKQTHHFHKIGGYTVPVCNTSYLLASEVGHQLCKMFPDHEFAATYSDNDCIRTYSLRSNNGFDVSAIAKTFGGGGHNAAAGYTIEIPSLTNYCELTMNLIAHNGSSS